jgi:hypothetical protein
MTDKELILLARIIAEDVEEIHPGKSSSGPLTLATRLAKYKKQYGEREAEIEARLKS